jgi:hypothetical protein
MFSIGHVAASIHQHVNKFQCSDNNPDERFEGNQEEENNDFESNQLMVSPKSLSVIDKCRRLGFGIDFLKPVFLELYQNLESLDENQIIDKVIEYAMIQTLGNGYLDAESKEFSQQQFSNQVQVRPETNPRMPNENLIESANYDPSTVRLNGKHQQNGVHQSFNPASREVKQQEAKIVPNSLKAPKTNGSLRPIVIDGDDVAYWYVKTKPEKICKNTVHSDCRIRNLTRVQY